MKVDLTKKVAIVTGGSEGIGKAIAVALAACGHAWGRSTEPSGLPCRRPLRTDWQTATGSRIRAISLGREAPP